MIDGESTERVAVILERVEWRLTQGEGRMKSVEDAVGAIDRDLYSTHAGQPGMALRVDRIEGHIARAFLVLQWIGGGGIAGLFGVGYLLYLIFRSLEESGGVP